MTLHKLNISHKIHKNQPPKYHAKNINNESIQSKYADLTKELLIKCNCLKIWIIAIPRVLPILFPCKYKTNIRPHIPHNIKVNNFRIRDLIIVENIKPHTQVESVKHCYLSYLSNIVLPTTVRSLNLKCILTSCGVCGLIFPGKL